MKKRFFYAICAMALATMVAVVACKKEKPQESNHTISEGDFHQMEKQVERILQFKKLVDTRKENPGVKNVGTMTLEEAMDNIVDLFNVVYSESMGYYTETEDHDFNICIPLTTGGKVLVDDAVAAYEQAVAEARYAYNGCSLENKAYKRLIVTSENGRNGDAILRFNGQYGTKGQVPDPLPNPHIDGPFSYEGYDWPYRYGLFCDETIREGANKVLRDTIMAKVCAEWPEPPAGYKGFYTHIKSFDFHAPEYSGVFYSTDVEQTCITWQHMNDYLYWEKKNIYDVVPDTLGISLDVQNNAIPLNRYFVIDVVIHGEENSSPSFIRHNTHVEYGRYNYVDERVIGQQQL